MKSRIPRYTFYEMKYGDYEAAPWNVFFRIQRYVVYPASLLFRLAKVLFLSAPSG